MCWSAPLPVLPVAGPSATPWLSASATSAASGVEEGKAAAGPVGVR